MIFTSQVHTDSKLTEVYTRPSLMRDMRCCFAESLAVMYFYQHACIRETYSRMYTCMYVKARNGLLYYFLKKIYLKSFM